MSTLTIHQRILGPTQNYSTSDHMDDDRFLNPTLKLLKNPKQFQFQSITKSRSAELSGQSKSPQGPSQKQTQPKNSSQLAGSAIFKLEFPKEPSGARAAHDKVFKTNFAPVHIASSRERKLASPVQQKSKGAGGKPAGKRRTNMRHLLSIQVTQHLRLILCPQAQDTKTKITHDEQMKEMATIHTSSHKKESIFSSRACFLRS